VEFLEDIIEKDPSEAFPPATDNDKIVYQNTGDKLIDKWEKQIADGKQPTIEDDFGDSEEIKKWLTAKKTKEDEMPPDVHDDFRKGR